MVGEIQKTIEEKKLKPSDCSYHTWRDLANRKGEYKGKVRILVIKGEDKARVEYKCPECSNEGYVETAWFKPFSFDCQKCKKKIKILRLKDEFKRDQKKALRAEEKAGKSGKKD